MRHFGIAGLSLLFLTACEGTIGNTFGGSALPLGPPAYVDLAEEADEVADRLATIGPTTIPVLGLASYDGVLVLADDADQPVETYTGDLSATADFSSDTLIGNAGGFFYDDDGGKGFGTPVPGSVDIASGDTSGAVFAVDVAGTVDLSAVNGTAVGTFAGTDADIFSAVGDDSVLVGTETWDILILGD